MCLAIVTPPVIWLALLQTNYVLAYPACEARTNEWLHWAGAIAFAASGVVAAMVWRLHRRIREASPDRFLLDTGLMIAVLFSLVIAAMHVPLFILRPCD